MVEAKSLYHGKRAWFFHRYHLLAERNQCLGWVTSSHLNPDRGPALHDRCNEMALRLLWTKNLKEKFCLLAHIFFFYFFLWKKLWDYSEIHIHLKSSSLNKKRRELAKHCGDQKMAGGQLLLFILHIILYIRGHPKKSVSQMGAPRKVGFLALCFKCPKMIA